MIAANVARRLLPRLSPAALVRSTASHAGLIRQLAVRDLALRYRGSVLGMVWTLVTPLALLAIFTYVFAVVFKARWPGMAEGASKVDFALAIFCGLVAFGLFSEPVGRSPSLIVSSSSYVKRIVFPLEILPVVAVCTALVIFLANLGVLVAATLVFRGGIPWTAAALPIIVAPVAVMALGVSWFLASLGVYLRDVGHAVALLLQMLFFLTPVFYPLAAVPEPFRTVVALNPITVAVESSRAVLLMGEWPDWGMLGLAAGVSVVIAQLGYAWFMSTKRGFADVL
ncbi:MAG: ABC transporter permease [Phycisphaerae bacterium]|nr:ABC transporter permease [Phycisphaerae bacterium]